ncbi:protein of unknown function [Methylorubrum extorquens]|uniref:Transposase n=1 Tax=Methylorubrum extorquens TaxID=408 RepID=A0A2N9AKD6_METEX|nr:protein of unknown function [Methylorubrum extorquens]
MLAGIAYEVNLSRTDESRFKRQDELAIYFCR